MGTLKIPSITSASRASLAIAERELVMDTDQRIVYTGDGAIVGGIPVGPDSQDIVYGVRWAHTASSPTLTKGQVIGGNFIPNSYTTYPIQAMMKRCVLDSSAMFRYYLDATDSINKENVAPTITGTTDGTTSFKCVNSSETFSTKGVVAGQWIKNTTRSLRALITAVDSETALSLSHDIFTTGEGYSVGTANPQVDGCVAVQCAYFHYIWIEDGSYTYILISRSPFIFRKPSDGSIVVSQIHPWFMEGGVYSNVKYVSAFESIWYKTATSSYSDHDGATAGSSGDKAVSLPGYKPLTYQYRRNATAYTGFAGLHAAFGSAFHSHGFFAYEALWILMVTEWGTLDGQAMLPGYTEASTFVYSHTRKTGRTMGLGNSSGSQIVDLAGLDADLSGILASGKAIANSFHGVENPFGHIWKWVDGFNCLWVGSGAPMTSARIYLCNNPASWVEDTATGYQDTGLNFTLSSGYCSALHPGRLLPKTATGSSSTYLCDYVYAPTTAGWRGLLVGGALYAGAGAGPASLHASYSGSGFRAAYLGGRAAC